MILGVFDGEGKLLGVGASPLQIWKEGNFVEVSLYIWCYGVCELYTNHVRCEKSCFQMKKLSSLQYRFLKSPCEQIRT